ncbi:PH domain-containing protein [Paenactinomyces guangxiensis]|uniref:PH domain-containing protein n=1 Tax=Paenactinomyces guangxiensis TaxID=1490290 RepID=A0A7W1WT36_9BACL|nr:PH domain-containing protein [Paenactinomyces guangxiensis]MBA4495565.1 PH domain-containing protein [Paenactinomyces guangxiensis]MBH8592823.1 PH domain-containing protein [Paenactinomyces guangxiensis]
MQEVQEEMLWEGTASHVAKLGTYLLCLLFCWLIVPIFIAIWTAIKLKATRYQLTTERLRIREGILSKRTEEVELYRVKDMSVEWPFIYRMFNKGNIRLVTSDHSAPTIVLEAISGADELMDVLREHVEICRDRKRVREIDLD